MPSKEDNYFENKKAVTDVKKAWLDMLADLNVCSQKGLVEMFDSSIGAGTVAMPYGGKVSVDTDSDDDCKASCVGRKTDTVTMMSYGYDPYLSSWSPYHGAIYAVVDSVAKIVASGGDYKKIHFTFQEYFERLGNKKERWGKPMSALLVHIMHRWFGLASIGGKDSMSGSFNEIDVPPTLVSFAVDVADGSDVITPEFKKAGNHVVAFNIVKDQYDLPDYAQAMKLYEAVHEMIAKKLIVSAYAVGFGGIAGAVSKMAFGHQLGAVLDKELAAEELFKENYGCIVAEVSADALDKISVPYVKVAVISETPAFVYGDTVIDMKEALASWNTTLEKVFLTKSHVEQKEVFDGLYETKDIYVCRHKVARPKVFIPVFPGTNCEYDTAKAFERAGADTNIMVFKNMNGENIRESVEMFEKGISDAQDSYVPGRILSR